MLNEYKYWLLEMANNNRSFKPFNVEQYMPLFDMIVGQAPKKYGLSVSSNYALCDSVLNSSWGKWNCATSREQKFIELFYRATNKLIERKYNM